VSDVAAGVRAHLRAHFARAGSIGEPGVASVTFVGVEPIDVLRFGPDSRGVSHYVSVGGSRHWAQHPLSGDEGTPAEVVISLRTGAHLPGLARSVSVIAAAPAVEGLVLTPDALVDLGQPLWHGAPFTAVLLIPSGIASLDGIDFLGAAPVTPTEAAWLRLKGTDAMRTAWQQDGVDILDPGRKASTPNG